MKIKLAVIGIVLLGTALYVYVSGKKRVQAATPPTVIVLDCTWNGFLVPGGHGFVVDGYDAPANAPQIATDGSVSCSAALGQLLAVGYAIHHTSTGNNDSLINTGWGPNFILVSPSSLAGVGN